MPLRPLLIGTAGREVIEPDTPTWIDSTCSGEDLGQCEFKMRSGPGIDQDEPEPIFEALRDEEFCGRKRKEIPAPVLAEISVCGFDFAYA